jgi:hypothetical protein
MGELPSLDEEEDDHCPFAFSLVSPAGPSRIPRADREGPLRQELDLIPASKNYGVNLRNIRPYIYRRSATSSTS